MPGLRFSRQDTPSVVMIFATGLIRIVFCCSLDVCLGWEDVLERAADKDAPELPPSAPASSTVVDPFSELQLVKLEDKEVRDVRVKDAYVRTLVPHPCHLEDHAFSMFPTFEFRESATLKRKHHR